ncbi:hypothetical protein PCCS19_02160 [Paenibacillus sp. CCS19]|uniref:hypothetical protein n=1 Tax=Paenibacillus sp. CCS19 TaxID=3158387 RepID=UPI0025659CD7|nr:hypothetical protein [Paenibacillus cellulosilyticus]GMK37163.1 hypothetical protein PCCS19_02160 [Paenibacillus cellulosilyticus]
MPKAKLWNGYFNLFIRTPIAALCFIIALIVGLSLLTSSITVREYISVQAHVGDGNKDDAGGNLLAAKLDKKLESIELHVGDDVVWYVEDSGNRYDGEIASIEASDVGSTVQIRTDAGQWDTAMKEADSQDSKITVDLPVGKQSVKEKLFGSKGGDAQ